MLLTTCDDAKEQGMKRYFTGQPCKRGHVAERQTSTKACLACKVGYEKKWGAENREYIAAKSAKYRERHAERVAAARLARYAANPEKHIATNRRWEQNHPDQARAINSAKAARHRASKRDATLRWLSAEHRAQILRFYDEAVALAKQTGIQHEVDHIVPLRGKTVRGLHVPWNLQVLPMRENRVKHNRLS